MTDSVHGYGRHARVRKTSASALHEQDGERMKQGRRAAQGRGGYPSPCCRAFVRQPHERRCRAFRWGRNAYAYPITNTDPRSTD